MSKPTVMTVGDLARHFGCEQQHVRRLFTRGVLPEPHRAGPYRLIPVSDMPKVEAALREAGYISQVASVASK